MFRKILVFFHRKH